MSNLILFSTFNNCVHFGIASKQLSQSTDKMNIVATEVVITDYELDGNSYKVKYRVTLWDHFGLDLPDIQPWKFAGYLDGFRAWFVLQHFLGYKPFITKITFTKEFKGSL